MLTAVAQDSGSKDYQLKFEAARKEIVHACTEHIAKFNIVMISLKRYHQSEPGFQTDQFFNFVKSKVTAFRPIYFKYFKMVEVDITMGILGTEIYFEAGTQVDSAQYLMRQFARIPVVNNFVLYEMLDVFGDLIPEIPEFKEQIKEFH